MGSLRNKVMVGMALGILLTGMAIAISDYRQSVSAMLESTQEQTETLGTLYSGHVSNWLNSKTQVLAAFPDSTKEPERHANLVYARDAAGFANVFIGYPDGSLVNAGNVVLPPDNRDPRVWGWYKGLAKAGPGFLLVDMPSVASATKEVVSSIGRGIFKDGKFVGAIAGDMPISAIMKELKYATQDGQRYLFITNRAGKIFAHSEVQLVNQPATQLGAGLSAEAISRMIETHGFSEQIVSGRASLIRVFPIAGTDYELFLVLDKARLMEPVYARLQRTMLVIAAVLAFFTLAGLLFLTRILAGLNGVRMAMRDISQGEGDLTRRIPIMAQDEIGETGQAFNHFITHLNDMLREVRDMTSELAGGVGDVHRAMLGIAADSQRVAESSTSNAATIEEVAANVSSIADSARDTNRLAEQTGASSREGSQNIDSIAHEMERAASSVQQVLEVMVLLETRSMEITTINQVISEITNQTNLLALNAAIEAAHAGDVGKGFAVVADEIRKLAERTAQATIEIAGMIHRIREETGSAMSSMRGTADLVMSTQGLTASARTSVHSIRNAMQDMEAMVNTIAMSTREQHDATSQLAQSNEGINLRIQQSDRSLQASLATLSRLNELARTIESVVGKFKL